MKKKSKKQTTVFDVCFTRQLLVLLRGKKGMSFAILYDRYGLTHAVDVNILSM